MEWLESDQTATVLIADDEFEMRFLLEKALVKTGFTVVTCESGGEAIELFDAINPDIVLLDVQMPGKDGFTVCQVLREKLKDHFVPIVMITGLEDLDSIEHAYRCGADDFISKPINWSILGHRIYYLLKGYRAFNDIRQKESRERALFRALPDTIFRVDHSGIVLDAHFSTKSHPLYFDLDQYATTSIDSVLANRGGEQLRHQLTLFQTAGASNNYYIEVNAHDETEEKSVFESRVANSGDSEYLFVIRDITEQRKTEARVKYLELFDNLTGLHNRTYLEQELKRLLELSKRFGRKIAVLFTNIDRFSRINDSYGLEVGDALLQMLAKRIKDCLRSYDITALAGDVVVSNLSRFSGDEFSVILESLETPEIALKVAQRLQKTVAAPFNINNHVIHIQLPIGVAISPDDGGCANQLIEKAESAMRAAKHKSPDGIEFYCQEISEAATRKVVLESELRYALKNNEFSIHLQPKVPLNGSLSSSSEALLRWNSGKLGAVSPVEFIPIAEEAGLILPISEWVINNVTALIRRLSERLGKNVEIAVNLSPKQFNDGAHLIDVLCNSVAREKININQLQLEITEYVLLDNTSKTKHILDKLREVGFKIAIDDFGTGYSSLNYLSKLEVDILKIDQTFVSSLNDLRSEKLARLIISIGHSLGMEVVAEGIETQEQLQFLTDQGCDFGQGYLFSKPLPIEQYIEYQLTQQKSFSQKKALLK